MHLDDRISMEPGSPRKGQQARFEYRGLLMRGGADAVWMHYGFDGWKNVRDQKMERGPYGTFHCTAEILGSQEVNFCFKDSANNWDNNSGQNWIARLS